MRIAFFTDTYTPQINGVVTSIRLFRDALEARGHEVHVFAPNPVQDDDEAGILRFHSLPFPLQPEMRVASPVSVRALNKVVKSDFDIIHSHDPFAIGLFGLTMARRERIPYVHTYHTLYPEYVHYVWDARWTKKMAETLSREFCDACDGIFAPSTKISRHLAEWGVTSPVHILPTGIDLEHYGVADAEDVAELRATLGIPAGHTIALFVGRLAKEKSCDRLIDAMARIERDDIHLLLVGDGPSRSELTAQAASRGVTHRVHFTGYLPPASVQNAYALADLFAFASLTETQGLVIGEAMAAGLPVVAVRDDAVGDFVIDYVNGRMVADDSAAIADAVVELVEDDELRWTLGKKSLELAQRLSIQEQARRLEEFYVAAIEGYKPRRYLPHDITDQVKRMGAHIPAGISTVRRIGFELPMSTARRLGRQIPKISSRPRWTRRKNSGGKLGD
ncbi:MAG TPA: glycosyltransferase family 4 protein [Coriobacteriia bacterium]|nr:glycosyltransferase family 4 protein [Coriobacteriia bacterium]